MGKFMNGMLVGLGVGLLFAPMTGEEMRRFIAERWQNFQHSLSNNGLHIPSNRPTTSPSREQRTPSEQPEQSVPSAGSQITDIGQQAELRATKTTSPNIEEGMPRRPSPSPRREGQGRPPTP